MQRASAIPWRRPNVRLRHSQRRRAVGCRMGRQQCASRGSSPTWPRLCATRCAPRVPGLARQHLHSPLVLIPSSNTPSTCLPPSPCSQDRPGRSNRNGLKQNQNPAQFPRNFGLEVVGLTAPFGARLITCEAELDEAERAVLALAPEIRADAVIVSAFGDPAAEALGEALNRPVVGIAEASMRAAARGGRRFAVVTTTPGLARRISERAVQLGLGGFC